MEPEAKRIIVKLSALYYLGMLFFCICWGLGLILHFLVNNRVFPKILDDEGITTRNGKRYLWADLENWERHRLVLNSTTGPRLTGNVTLFFTKGKVIIGSFPIENLNEVLAFLAQKLAQDVTTG
jgi:hypothetical protein